MYRETSQDGGRGNVEKVRNARGMWKKGEIGRCRRQTVGVPGKGRIDVDSNPGLLDTGNDPVKMGREEKLV